jgi:hypothetical protein
VEVQVVLIVQDLVEVELEVTENQFLVLQLGQEVH